MNTNARKASKAPAINTVRFLDSMAGIQLASTINDATDAAALDLQQAQEDATTGRYRPDIAVRLILDLEKQRRGMMLAAHRYITQMGASMDCAAELRAEADNLHI
jgi:hypothetical protein